MANPNPFRIGGQVFVHADHVCIAKPHEGPNRGVPYRFLSAKSLSASNDGKAIELRGSRIEAVAVALAESSSSFSIGLEVMHEAVAYADFCGPGAQRMAHEIEIVFTRPGLAPVTFYIRDAIMEKLLNLKSDSGAQPTNEISGKNRVLEIGYRRKILNPFARPVSI